MKALIKNVGNAGMPVDLAATSGNRFEDPNGYRESRDQMNLEPGEQREIVLHCDFEPDRLVVDPDINVFQLQRNAAIFRFSR